jgi:hypothetical protein
LGGMQPRAVSRHPMIVQQRELFVPDLTPAPAGIVDATGHVGCIACGKRFPLADVEVVGLGFRCSTCALEGNSETAHLTEAERAQLRPEPRPRSYLVVGLAILALAAVMWMCGWDIRFSHRSSLFVWLFVAGVGLTGTGWLRWLDRHG